MATGHLESGIISGTIETQTHMQKQWRDKGREYLDETHLLALDPVRLSFHVLRIILCLSYITECLCMYICVARFSLCLRLNFGVYALSYSKFGLMFDVLDMFSSSDSFWMYFYFSNDCCTPRPWKPSLHAKCYGNIYILSIAGNRADAEVAKSIDGCNSREIQGSHSTESIFILNSCSLWKLSYLSIVTFEKT